MLAVTGSPAGYLILKNEAVKERSNQAVRDFLSRSLAVAPVGADAAAS